MYKNPQNLTSHGVGVSGCLTNLTAHGVGVSGYLANLTSHGVGASGGPTNLTVHKTKGQVIYHQFHQIRTHGPDQPHSSHEQHPSRADDLALQAEFLHLFQNCLPLQPGATLEVKLLELAQPGEALERVRAVEAGAVFQVKCLQLVQARQRARVLQPGAAGEVKLLQLAQPGEALERVRAVEAGAVFQVKCLQLVQARQPARVLQPGAAGEVEVLQAGEPLEGVRVLQGGGAAEVEPLQAGEALEGVEVRVLAVVSDQPRGAEAEEERAEPGEVAARADVEVPVALRPSLLLESRTPVLADEGDGLADFPPEARGPGLADGGAVVVFAPAEPGGGGEGEQQQPAPDPAPAGRNLRGRGRKVFHAPLYPRRPHPPSAKPPSPDPARRRAPGEGAFAFSPPKLLDKSLALAGAVRLSFSAMRHAHCIYALLALLHGPALAGPPVIKAKVGEPVLQELMGGCSLKCGFAWSVEVQSAVGQKPIAVKVLNDESADTAWVAPGGVSGVGVKFRLLFPKKLRAEVEGQIPFYGLDFINGVAKSEELWKAHGRVKRVRLYYNDQPFREVLFADSRRWQRLTFDDIMVRSGDSLTVEILEIYPGEKGAGAGFAEIVLQGAH